MKASDQRGRARRGSIESTVLMGLVGVCSLGYVVLGGITSVFEPFFNPTVDLNLVTTPSFQGPFIHTVLERGEIESSSNVEVRSQVRGTRSSTGFKILEIVPEGSWVEEGDFLVRLDDSSLQMELIQQQIVCSNSEAATIEAQAKLDSAKLALNEYAEGTFKELLTQQQSLVFVAEENLRRAEEYLLYSKRLAERGYIPESQLEADRFALEKANKELGVAETKLEVLSKFTRERMLTQLEADIKTAEAKLASRQKTWDLDQKQLAKIKEQIELCLITAPVAGQVVYENKRGRSSSTVLIEEGMPVRERQTIINLPDPNKMRVVAKVHESRVGFVQKGQRVDLRLDAMPELALTGRVTSVSDYPLPAISVYMAHVKEYSVEIEIDSPPLDLRPGMTAEVNVLVEQLDDALQLPIESVIERNDEYFCAIADSDGSVQQRRLEIGTSNETHLVVVSGVDPGESVVLNVADEEIMAELSLPEEES
ncbi:MAG: HlyD family efflux transporter periplasmic adaptor subunit [Planctomycetota bacterium]